METMHLSCTVFELQRVTYQKLPILTYPTCICRTSGVTPFKFCRDLAPEN